MPGVRRGEDFLDFIFPKFATHPIQGRGGRSSAIGCPVTAQLNLFAQTPTGANIRERWIRREDLSTPAGPQIPSP